MTSIRVYQTIKLHNTQILWHSICKCWKPQVCKCKQIPTVCKRMYGGLSEASEAWNLCYATYTNRYESWSEPWQCSILSQKMGLYKQLRVLARKEIVPAQLQMCVCDDYLLWAIQDSTGYKEALPSPLIISSELDHQFRAWKRIWFSAELDAVGQYPWKPPHNCTSVHCYQIQRLLQATHKNERREGAGTFCGASCDHHCELTALVYTWNHLDEHLNIDQLSAFSIDGYCRSIA